MNGLELKPFMLQLLLNVFQNHKLKMKLLGFFFTFLLIFFFIHSSLSFYNFV